MSVRVNPEGGARYKFGSMNPSEGSSNGGSNTPKQTPEEKAESMGDMQAYAMQRLPSLVEEAKLLAARISDPEVVGEDRKAALAERRQVQARLAAVKRLLGV